MPEVVVDDLAPKEQVQQKEPLKGGEAKYVTLEELEKIRQQQEQVVKQLNGLSYLGRKMDEFLKGQQNQVQPVTQPVATGPKDELDELVEKDWKAAVKKLSRMEFDEIKKAEVAEQEQKVKVAKFNETLEKSKSMVLGKYQDLADPQSELSQRYLKVVQEHPEYLQNEFGPVLAMRDMEDLLKQEGKLDDVSKKVVDKEVLRQTRAGIATVSKGGASRGENSNVLTAEDKELCDNLGLKYEVYLANKKKLQKGEGLESNG